MTFTKLLNFANYVIIRVNLPEVLLFAGVVLLVVDKQKFKNASGAKRLRGIFIETTPSNKKHTAVYTLKPEDHKGYPSLKRLYLETEDTTEYTFANAYLFDYNHWLDLCRTTWFGPTVAEWREELRLKLEARYLEKMKETAEAGGKEGLVATRILLERNKKPKEATKREKSYGGSGHPWKTRRNASNSDLEGIEEKGALITSDAYKRLFKSATP